MPRVIEITTPLEKDLLLFHSMRATEEISTPFEYELELLSEDPNVPLDDLLGKGLTISLERADGRVRHFNGLCSRVSQGARQGRFHRYHATVRPWLWFLTRTRNYRIFQEKSVPDILKEMFNLHSAIADVSVELTESYGPWTYCVQYGESDFAFISRLMEHEGIYYFFRHTEGKHTLVIADSPTAHTADYDEELPFIPPEERVRPELEYINEWSVSREVRPGKYSLSAYDFEKPSVDLQVRSNITRPHALADLEVFEYHWDYIDRNDGETYARARIEEQQSKYERATGSTNARALSPGGLFTLAHHPRADQNAQFLVVAAQYELRGGEHEGRDAGAAEYSCRFTALNSRQPFRAERITPKPVVQGPQTALVVGPGGEDIHTDQYGRVKVHFYWDRKGNRDDTSSCWIRVSQNWGGKNWGGMFIPHVGQEVIVQFEGGDPDLPLITGRVYNAEQMPPVELPGGKTKSIIRDHGNNEIIMEGAAGKQQMRLFCPTHDTTVTMGNSWRLFTSSDKIEQNHGNHDEQIGGNSTHKVGGSLFEGIVGKHKIEVGGDLIQFYGGVTHRNYVGWISTAIGGFKTEFIGGWETKFLGGAQKTVIKGRKTEIISGTTYKIHAGDAREWRNSSTDEKTPAERLKYGQLKAIYGQAKAQVDGAYKLKAAAALEEFGNSVKLESATDAQLKAAGQALMKAPDLKLQGDNLIAKAPDIKFDSGKCAINKGTLTIK